MAPPEFEYNKSCLRGTARRKKILVAAALRRHVER